MSGTTCNSGYGSLSQEQLCGCRCGAGRGGFRGVKIWLSVKEKDGRSFEAALNQSLLSAAPDLGPVLKVG